MTSLDLTLIVAPWAGLAGLAGAVAWQGHELRRQRHRLDRHAHEVYVLQRIAESNANKGHEALKFLEEIQRDMPRLNAYDMPPLKQRGYPRRANGEGVAS